MSKLQRIFQRYTGVLRSLKATYFLHNLLNVKRLKHNRTLYKRYGLNKSIFSPIGAKDFRNSIHAEEIPWLDQPDSLKNLESNTAFQGMTSDLQQKVRQFEREGYLVLENFFSQADTDRLNQTVEELLQNGKAGYNFTGRKIFNLWEISPFARDQFFKNPELNQLLSFLLGRKVIPFQSLNFTLGSEQRAHSDAIHMTTQPQGYLIAAWIALEDVHEGCGPLVYYPGSHRLPFVSTQDYNSGNSRFTLGHESNKHYEDKIEEIIQQKGLEKKVFLPKRGDVLVWHSNLIHGGSPITTPGATRKSMVCHYYAEGVICYHEMSQRPALLS